jgi:transposase
MRRRELRLTASQRAELVATRNRDPRPYLRERCAVLLSIADGLSVRTAARTGGQRPHHPETVTEWLTRYEATGLLGLRQRPRRHAGFPPSGV